MTEYINEKKAKLAAEAKAREEALRPAPVLGNSSDIIVKEPTTAKKEETEKADGAEAPATPAEAKEEAAETPAESDTANESDKPAKDERGNDEPADKSDKEDKKDE